MNFYYKVFHRDNPNGAVILAFKEEKSIITVKGEACKNGFFEWRETSNLCVRKTKKQQDLTNYVEVIDQW